MKKKKNSAAPAPGGEDQGGNKPKKKKKSHRASNIILVLILLVGAGIAGYPAFSDYWNSMHQSRAIMGYGTCRRAEQRGIQGSLERGAGV